MKFVLSTLVAVAYSLSLEGEGVSIKNVSVLDLRIFNGYEAKIGQFPWQAFLAISSDSSYGTCGGSLIRSQWVLTAAHCLGNLGSRPNRISIWLGTIDRSSAKVGVFRLSSDYYIHEDYNQTSLHNDIALVKLNETVKYTENVRAIILGKKLFPGSHVQVSGFGDTQDTVRNTKLYYAKLITVKNHECIKETGHLVLNNEVCAKPVNGSTCSGDSGSPLVMQEKGVWKQFGVFSSTLYNGCELGTSIYTRISHYRSWILQKIRLYK